MRTSELTAEELMEIKRRRRLAKAKARRQERFADPSEDARILEAALSDPDALPMTDAQLARMRPAHEVLPAMVAEYIRNKGGRPKAAVTKKAVSIRLDPDVLSHFRSLGPGWQTKINAALRRHLPKKRA